MAGRGDDSVHDAMRTEKTAGSRRRRLQSKPKANSSQRSLYICDCIDCNDCGVCQLVMGKLDIDIFLQRIKEESVSPQEAQKIQEEDTLHSEEMEDDTEHTLSSETEDEAPKYTLCVAPVKTQSYTIPVDIQAAEKPLKTVELTVDPGSAVSVLPRCVYEEHFKDVPLHHSTSVQMICSQGPMMEQGYMQATVHRNGVQVPAYFYVMDLGLGTTALMGRVLISALQLHIKA